jgi:hypothetical protein
LWAGIDDNGGVPRIRVASVGTATTGPSSFAA